MLEYIMNVFPLSSMYFCFELSFNQVSQWGG